MGAGFGLGVSGALGACAGEGLDGEGLDCVGLTWSCCSLAFLLPLPGYSWIRGRLHVTELFRHTCGALGFTPLAWPCVPFCNALFGFPNLGGGPLGLVFPVEPLACEVFSLAALARSNCSSCARFHSNSFIFSSGIAHFTCGFAGRFWICPG